MFFCSRCVKLNIPSVIRCVFNAKPTPINSQYDDSYLILLFAAIYLGVKRLRSWGTKKPYHCGFFHSCGYWHLSFIIRLEARLPLNIGFTLWRVLVVFTHLAITPPKVNRFGWSAEHSWVYCWGLAPADFGRDPHSSDIWRARRNFVFVCQVSNAQFYQFRIGQILRKLNTTRQSVFWWKFLEQNFENFSVSGRFFKKKQFLKIF